MTQGHLFDGETYDAERDEERLQLQLHRVWQVVRDGRWYINVHSAGTYAGCEIRGQLLYVIPEPEHYAAFAGLSLLAFAGYRRFKRNAQPASQSA